MRKQLHVVFCFASHRGQNRGVLPSNFEIGLLKPRQVAELTNRLHAQPCCRSPCCRCACVADGGCGLQEIGLFFEVSLCLSRACLGKRMHFSIKMAQKWRFLAPRLLNRARSRRACDKNATVFIGFQVWFGTCTFVPSLSWQTTSCFSIISKKKKGVANKALRLLCVCS